VSDLIASGGGKLIAFSCVDINGNALMPCGRCRQLLQEHGGSALQLMTDQGVKPLSELLPWAFGPEEITNRLPS
jgi:cytidine deaminase